VKVIPLELPDGRRAAGREISSITRLEANVRRQHPNLLKIHHVGKTADLLFYVMDPADDVAGGPASSDRSYTPATLQQRLRSGLLSPDDCSRCARELLAGLASLHEAGMVHRDVKPSNCLFVDADLKLADFGLLAESDPQISRLGTEMYMPPDGRMDMRADVYAAGLVIYEMVTGLPAERFPELGDRANEVIDHPVLGALNRLALRACQPRPDDRFEDARVMLGALGAPASMEGGRPRRSPARIVALSAVTALVIVATAVGPWLRNRTAGLFGVPQEGSHSYVEVNFVTRPFNATIYLDEKLQTKLDGTPYLTPCTALVTPGVHHTLFKLDGHPDLEVGDVDYSARREIEATWPASPSR
jgi:serine/threonine protein kinase